MTANSPAATPQAPAATPQAPTAATPAPPRWRAFFNVRGNVLSLFKTLKWLSVAFAVLWVVFAICRDLYMSDGVAPPALLLIFARLCQAEEHHRFFNA